MCPARRSSRATARREFASSPRRCGHCSRPKNGKIVPSQYARNAKAAKLDIITWTLERSGRIVEEVLPTKGTASPSSYYQTTLDALTNDGDIMVTLDVLARQVGVLGHLLRLVRHRQLLRELHGPGLKQLPVGGHKARVHPRESPGALYPRASMAQVSSLLLGNGPLASNSRRACTDERAW